MMGAWGLETPTEGRPDRSKPQHQPYLPALGCANILDQSKIAGEEEIKNGERYPPRQILKVDCLW